MSDIKRDLLTYKKKDLVDEIIKQRSYNHDLEAENKKLNQKIKDLELQIESLKNAINLSDDELKTLAESKKKEAKLSDTLSYIRNFLDYYISH